MAQKPLISVVIPCYNEEESLPQLVERLEGLRASLPEWEVEVILVDDHSTDKTTAMLRDISQHHSGYHYLRLARNSGSHVAILAGLSKAEGECAIFLAADLQDPPELIPQFLERWQAGYKVVWAVREQREGISRGDALSSSLFYRLLILFSDTTMPPNGTDFALIDRVVIHALLISVGANLSLFLEIARLGFTQTEIYYTKAERQFGTTKWNLSKKLAAFADAFISTTYTPLRLMSYLGMFISTLGFLYALLVITLRLLNITPIEGWAALMVVTLVFGGIQMVMLGVIGEYLWRTLEHARNRPIFFIEESDESAPVIIQEKEADDPV